MAAPGLDIGPQAWETLEGLARICEVTKRQITAVVRSRMMEDVFQPFKQWRDTRGADGQVNANGRAADQATVRNLFSRHLELHNSKYLRPGENMLNWNRMEHITAFLLRLYNGITADGELFAGKVFHNNPHNRPQVDLMFTALYCLYRFKSKRTLASQQRRPAQRYGLELLEEEEAQNHTEHHFTPEEAAASQARYFQEMEDDIAAAEEINRIRETTSRLLQGLKLAEIIAKARNWMQNYPRVLELDSSCGTAPYNPNVWIGLRRVDLELLMRFSALDHLKLEATDFSFNAKERLWKYVLCHWLSVDSNQLPGFILPHGENLNVNRLAFHTHNFVNPTILQKASIQEFNDNDHKAFNLMSSSFHNPNVSHNPVAEAVRFFGALERPGGYLVPCMSRAFVFKSWQLGGALEICHRYRTSLMEQGVRGVLLGDEAGTGKTATVLLAVAAIIKFLNENWNQLTVDQRASANKPMFLLSPAQNFNTKRGLLQEVANMIGISQFVKTFIYHGDDPVKYRNHPAGPWVAPGFTAESNLFKTEYKYHQLFLSTRETMVARHGQPAMTRWFSHAYQVDETEAKRTVESWHGIPHPAFPLSLQHLWSCGFVDESQEYENADTAAADLLVSLSAGFHIFISGTLLQGIARRARTYIKLLEPASEVQLFSRYPVANPYIAANDHELATLRLTQRAFDKWIDNQESIKQAAYLRSAFEPITIARNFKTPIAPDTTRTIGDALPESKALIVHSKHQTAAQDLYEHLAKPLIKKVYRKSTSKRRRLDINFAIVRKLLLMSNFPWMFYVENRYTAEHIDTLAKKASVDFFISEFYAIRVESDNPHYSVPTNELNILMKVKAEWPKFRKLTADLAELSVVSKRNILLLCEQPATALWIYHALKLVDFNVSFIYSALSFSGRDMVLEDYMEADQGSSRILLGTMRMLKTGHNLQFNTDTIIFFDSPITESTRTQCIHRIQRLSSPFHYVDIREYTIQDTWYDPLFLNRLKQSLPGLMLMLDEEALGMSTVNGAVQLQDEWVWDAQQMVLLRKTDQAFIDLGDRGLQLPSLTFEELLEKLLQPRLGEQVLGAMEE